MTMAIRLLTVLVFLIGSTVMADTRPRNFVFILADDLGVKDLSSQGSSFYESPHIDRIADEGMRFTQGYANCQVCSPSRAAIMTGKYTPRVGITDYIGAAAGTQWKRNTKLLPALYEHDLPHSETTIAEALHAAGYRTFFAGKWHLGSKGSWPTDHGFDINVGGWDAGSPTGGYFSPYKNPVLPNGPAGESLPIRLARETAKFLEENRDKKFFAYLAFYSVHGPIQTTPEKWAKYRQKALALSHPDGRFLIDRTMPVRQVQDCPIYAGMIESMDQAVGIVLDKLDALGLADNTVVVFTSDNGGVSSGDSFSTCNLPFRGGKGRQWEGGIHEPYFIKVPGLTSPGSHCDVPVIGTDFYPTILELADLPLNPAQHQDGVSLVPLMKGGSIATRDLFWHYPHYGNQGGEPSSIIRSGNWKLIHYWEDGRDELYNLAEDIGEQHDQIRSMPEVAKELREKLDRWLKQVNAKIPPKNPNYDAQLAERQRENMRTRTLPSLEKRHADYLKPGWKPNKDWWGSRPDGVTID